MHFNFNERPSMIRIRFVTANTDYSRLIRFQAGLSMPFTPSHVETLTQDGKFYIGALSEGITKHPVGYDSATMITETIVNVPCTPEQEKAFYDFAESKVGLPYDWDAIGSFADPALNLHTPFHGICSAFICWCLRNPTAPYLKWPMTKPFHRISPDILMLILSTHVEVPHEPQ